MSFLSFFFLNQYGRGNLQLASYNGHGDTVRILLENGADVNSTDYVRL